LKKSDINILEQIVFSKSFFHKELRDPNSPL